MALESGFFNSVGGDRLYNADDMSRYFEHILSNGIFKRINRCMEVTPADGMTLAVAPGAGLINCRWFRAAAAETVTIPAAHAVLPRFDIVVARLDMSDSVRAVTLQVISGTPSESPAAPDPVRTPTVHDLVLALVYVDAGASYIDEYNITDVRDNEYYCGYVQSLVNTPILKTFHSRYTAPLDDTTVAPIGVVGFNAGGDLLNVYANGFRLAPCAEYAINTTTASITLLEPVDAGTVIDFEVYRPVMADNIPDIATVVTDMAQAVTELSSRVTELEADTGWMELTGAPGINFSAAWVPKLRRVGKTVHLRGLCTGVTANQTQICTIPAAYRPPSGGHAYVGYCGNADDVRAARLFVEDTGEVIFRSAGAKIPSSSDPILITTSWLID